MEDEDINDIYTEIVTAAKPAHKRKTGRKTIKVRGSVEVALSNYKKAKRLQKDNIKRAKRDIKSFKLLIRQARNGYKLIKLNES